MLHQNRTIMRLRFAVASLMVVGACGGKTTWDSPPAGGSLGGAGANGSAGTPSGTGGIGHAGSTSSGGADGGSAGEPGAATLDWLFGENGQNPVLTLSANRAHFVVAWTTQTGDKTSTYLRRGQHVDAAARELVFSTSLPVDLTHRVAITDDGGVYVAAMHGRRSAHVLHSAAQTEAWFSEVGLTTDYAPLVAATGAEVLAVTHTFLLSGAASLQGMLRVDDAWSPGPALSEKVGQPLALLAHPGLGWTVLHTSASAIQTLDLDETGGFRDVRPREIVGSPLAQVALANGHELVVYSPTPGRLHAVSRSAGGNWGLESVLSERYNGPVRLAASGNGEIAWAAWFEDTQLDCNATLLMRQFSIDAGWASEPQAVTTKASARPNAMALAVHENYFPELLWVEDEPTDAGCRASRLWNKSVTGGPRSLSAPPEWTPDSVQAGIVSGRPIGVFYDASHVAAAFLVPSFIAE